MNNYIELTLKLTPCDETRTDIIAALLADAGYESFVPSESSLTAYIPENDFNPVALPQILGELPLETKIEVTHKLIEGEDWNSEWEKHYFKPIVIAGECVIHSSFHTDIPKCRHDIVIDPKMAFGTGHHATTSLIVEQLLELDLHEKKVIDMGTGTGILSILAAMRGAEMITGIEIDPFAAENARENTLLNHQPEIRIITGDASQLESIPYKADLFLANINRNVITADLHAYADAMANGATMILSGFYREDIAIVAKEAAKYGLTPIRATDRDNWTALILKKQQQ